MTNKTSTSSSSGGVGFIGLLTIVFITLKLTHVIDWDWWWVLSPLWIAISVLIAIFLVAVAVIFVRDKYGGSLHCLNFAPCRISPMRR